MKKKLFSILLMFTFIFIGAISLTGCGDTGVTLHNKTYKLGSDITWSAHTLEMDTSGTIETKVDINTWLQEHASELQLDGFTGEKTPENVLNYLKNDILTNNSEIVLLKDAIITVGKEQVKSESIHESTLSLKMNNTEIFNTLIFTDTYNNTRTEARLSNGSATVGIINPFTFKLSNYNVKDGKINNIEVNFIIAVQNGEDSYNYTTYSTTKSLPYQYGGDKYLYLEGTVKLADFAENK